MGLDSRQGLYNIFSLYTIITTHTCKLYSTIQGLLSFTYNFNKFTEYFIAVSIVTSKIWWDSEGANAKTFIKHRVAGLISQIILRFRASHFVSITNTFNWFLNVLLNWDYMLNQL